jgi:hypothetical protein
MSRRKAITPEITASKDALVHINDSAPEPISTAVSAEQTTLGPLAGARH